MVTTFNNMQLQRLAFTFIMMLFFFEVFAQKDFRQGFIISEKGDTTFGYLDYKESWISYEYCQFKNNLSSDLKVYYPNELMGYGFLKDKVFVSRSISKDSMNLKTAFIEVLVRGKMSLYLYNGKYYIEKDSSGLYVLEKESKEVELNGSTYVVTSVKNGGILQLFMGDCREVRSHLKKITVEGKALSEIVLNYNNCGKDSVIEYNAGKKWTKVNLGVSIGGQRSKLNFSSNYGYFKYLTNSNYSDLILFPSIYLDISSPRLYEKLYFQVGLSYLKRSFYSDKTIQYSGLIERDENYMSFSTIKIPLSFKYQFPVKVIRPHFLIGATGYITTNSKSWRILEREVAGQHIVYTDKGESFKIGSNYWGIHAALGASRTFSKRLTFLVEARYEIENTSTFFFYEPIKLKANSFILNTGLVF
jgi:hypothetical protein